MSSSKKVQPAQLKNTTDSITIEEELQQIKIHIKELNEHYLTIVENMELIMGNNQKAEQLLEHLNTVKETKPRLFKKLLRSFKWS